MKKVVAFAGSARKDSVNKKLLKITVSVAKEQGLDVRFIDLADYEMPLYTGDLEEKEGIPKNAKQIKTLVTEADALLLASPEYNSGVTPLLKNTIDWISRQESEDEPFLSAFKGKKAAILSASPSEFGGARSLKQLRSILSNIQVEVLEKELTLPKAYGAFDESSSLKDQEKMTELESFISAFAKFV